MTRVAFLLYGVVSYFLFFASILYGIGFIGNIEVSKGIDDGRELGLVESVAMDVGLLLLFAVQHNVMARPRFRVWWTRFVPRTIERSTFVAIASLLLMLLYLQWRPLPTTVWHVENSIGRALLGTLYFAGWATVFYSSFVIDHFELFGLRQVWSHLRNKEHHPPSFSSRSLYRWVRHPLMLGFLIAFWSAPAMSQGRLLFAVVTTAWILFAIQIEERDLAYYLGAPYEIYRKKTPMLVPFLRFNRGND